MLHTSRTNPSQDAGRADCPPWLDPATDSPRSQTADGVYDLTPLVLDNIEYLGLDYLVTIGGDDTLSYLGGARSRPASR